MAIWRQPADLYEIAVASPVYFLPKEFRRPEPASARVTLRVTDAMGDPLAASVSVLDMGREIGRRAIDESGNVVLEAPATAALLIRAAGYADARRDLYLDSPISEYCRNFNGFYTPEAWNHLREMLRNLSFDVRLARVPGQDHDGY